jgi:hypothetical protein
MLHQQHTVDYWNSSEFTFLKKRQWFTFLKKRQCAGVPYVGWCTIARRRQLVVCGAYEPIAFVHLFLFPIGSHLSALVIISLILAWELRPRYTHILTEILLRCCVMQSSPWSHHQRVAGEVLMHQRIRNTVKTKLHILMSGNPLVSVLMNAYRYAYTNKLAFSHAFFRETRNIREEVWSIFPCIMAWGMRINIKDQTYIMERKAVP